MANRQKTLLQRLKFEFGLFVGLLFCGFVLMPIAIWFIGQNVFGAYGGEGYSDFFGTLSARIRSGDFSAWFLVLSPWVVILILRLMGRAWRATGEL
ncbi:MAG: hypothetical protein ACE5F8_06385 [Woeseiaceae bacterium]